MAQSGTITMYAQFGTGENTMLTAAITRTPRLMVPASGRRVINNTGTDTTTAMREQQKQKVAGVRDLADHGYQCVVERADCGPIVDNTHAIGDRRPTPDHSCVPKVILVEYLPDVLS